MNALANDLQTGIEILWYKIESVLGRGGFGITYLATDTNLDQLVAIKEYLPHEFGTRSGDSTVQPLSVAQKEVYDWGLERFMSEAQTLAKFKHANIVRVLSVFKENNTGYMVMEYEEGEDLSYVYKRKWNLSQRELEDVYYPIIDGLASVHKEGFIHRDIKPANIYIRADGSPVLLDFGAARQAVGTKTKTLTSMLSIGYAPFEQYSDAQGKQGAWTDIYALGASIHQGITGEKPLESTIRAMALVHKEPDPYEPLSHSNPEGYTPAFLRAIDEALRLQINDRPQTLEEFLGMLKGEIELPDLPKADELDPEATVVRAKTVLRPRKKKLTDVDATDPDQYIKTEIIARAKKVPPRATNAVNKERTPESRPAEQGISTKAKILFAMVGIAAIIIAGVIFFPGLKMPGEIQTAEEIPTQTAEEIQTQKVDSLLKKADELIANGKYYDKSGEGALSAYQQVIAIEPGNLAAKNGINNVGQHYLLQAGQYIDVKDFAQANASLEVVNSIDSDFPGLKKALARFSQNIDTEKKFKQIEILLSQASTALDKGQVYEPDQKSAIFYYRNVLKLDLDNVTAKLGLFQIADGLIDGAQNALDENDTKHAEKLIGLAETIDPEKTAIQTIRQQIKNTIQLEITLAKADSAYVKDRYTGPNNDNAYKLYNEVLDIAPSNQHARGQLEKIANFYADKTQDNIRSGQIKSAKINLGKLETYFPGNSDISKLKSAIDKKQGQISASRKIANIMAKADSAYAKSRYTTPKNDNAYELYKQALAIAPSNTRAQERLNRIADYYADRTRSYTRSGNITSANTSLDTLENYFPDNSSIAKLKSAISKKQSQIEAANLAKKTPSTTRQLLPAGVNQKQDDNQVVQDVVGLFINAFKNRDMIGLLKVSHLTSQQQALYASIFKSYQSLNIKVAPNSFSLSKINGVARIKFEIIDLVDSNGNSAITSANWTKIELKITKNEDGWSKAAII